MTRTLRAESDSDSDSDSALFCLKLSGTSVSWPSYAAAGKRLTELVGPGAASASVAHAAGFRQPARAGRRFYFMVIFRGLVLLNCFIPFLLASCESSSGPSSKSFFYLIPNQRHERMWRFPAVKVGSLRLRGGSENSSLSTQQAMELYRKELLRIIEMQSALIRNQDTELRNQKTKIRNQETEIRMRSGQFT